MKPTKRQIMIVEHFVKKTTKSMMKENESREMIRAANRISSVIEQVFDKYGLDGSRFGPTNDKDLAGKRILNAIPSEIADIILANSEIIKLIKAG